MEAGFEGIEFWPGLEAAPFGVAVFDQEGRFRFINPYLAAINGLSVAEHLGRLPEDLDPSHGTRQWVEWVRSVLSTGVTVGPLRFRPPDRDTVLEVSYHPVPGPGGGVGAVMATVRDVTGVVAAEQREQTLLAATTALTRTTTVEQVAEQVIDHAVGRFADRMACAVVTDSGVEVLAMRGYDETVVDRFWRQPLPLDAPFPLCDAVRSGQTMVLDTETMDDRYPHLVELRHQIGDNVIAVVPVLADGAPVAVLRCGWSSPTRGVSADLEVIETLAAVMGGALRRVRLAARVADDRFRRALDASVDGIAIAHAVRDDTGQIVDFVIDYANNASVDVYDRAVPDLVGRSVTETYPALRSSGLFDMFCEVVTTGTPFTAPEYPYTDTSTDPPIVSWHQMNVVRFDDGYLASTRDVTAAVRARQELEAARITVEAERQATTILQQVGLQTTLPTGPGFTIGAVYQPYHDNAPVGGDWYEVFPLDDHRLGVILGDVAGHGRDAAVAMIEVRSLLGALARTGQQAPHQTLQAVRQIRWRHETMVTCLYAIIDLRDLTLTVTSAGHPPPIIAHPTATPTVSLLPVRPGPPLGLGLSTTDTDTTVALRSGVSLVFYTDGLIERPSEHINTGLSRLCAAIDPTLDAVTQCDHLVQRLGPHRGSDDYCLVTVTLT